MSKTLIGVILDRSGSMSDLRQDVIGGFNMFLAEQKKLPGEAALTMVQFDHEYLVVHNNTPIQEVPPLTEQTYVPRDRTALFDAIGRTLNEISAKVVGEPDTKVIVFILTDGQENASREYDASDIYDMLAAAKARGWKFFFFGANESEMQAERLGIDRHHTTGFTADSQGTQSSFRDMSQKSGIFRREDLEKLNDSDPSN